MEEILLREGGGVRILSASTDQNLNRTRALLLKRHGSHVVATQSKEHAREQIEHQLFDGLIFGSTLPSDTCWELADIFRKRNATGRIIEIISSPWATPKNRPDGTVASTEEPSKLITLVGRVSVGVHSVNRQFRIHPTPRTPA